MRHNYNYTRRKLYLPEYGRHIHEMVDQLMEIEDRDERNRQARIVIAVMGNLQPMLRDTADFTHKLWDHLFIMSDFQLDVDSPYPRPTREELMISPRKMEYSQERIAYKHYGKYVSHIIRKLRDSRAILRGAEKYLVSRFAIDIGVFFRKLGGNILLCDDDHGLYVVIDRDGKQLVQI
jgi:hypothetical protein